jgi:hypothetical protein
MEAQMNRIKVKRLVMAGAVTLLVFIAVEFLVESVIGQALFGRLLEEWYHTLDAPTWGVTNIVLNILIALVNCTILTWLYAALRPMFGVGTKTALITSAFALFFVAAFAANGVNLGLYPLPVALTEWGVQLVELPIAIIAGARFYEGE